jgi:hypothetical protein
MAASALLEAKEVDLRFSYALLENSKTFSPLLVALSIVNKTSTLRPQVHGHLQNQTRRCTSQPAGDAPRNLPVWQVARRCEMQRRGDAVVGAPLNADHSHRLLKIDNMVCVFITVVPIIKLFARREGDSEGHATSDDELRPVWTSGHHALSITCCTVPEPIMKLFGWGGYVFRLFSAGGTCHDPASCNYWVCGQSYCLSPNVCLLLQPIAYYKAVRVGIQGEFPEFPGGGVYYCSTVCVFLLLQDLVQRCLHGGGGGHGRTCATRDDEPRPVWTRLPITH